MIESFSIFNPSSSVARHQTILNVVPLILVWTLCGCGLYFHDEPAAKTANIARDTWAKVRSEPALNVALTNLDSIAKAELQIVEDQARQDLSLLLQAIPNMTWAEIEIESIAGLKTAIESFEFSSQELKQNTQQLKGLKEAFTIASNALSLAQKAVIDEENKHPLLAAEKTLSIAMGSTQDTATKKAYDALIAAKKEHNATKFKEAENSFLKIAASSSDANAKQAAASYQKARTNEPSIYDLDTIITGIHTNIMGLSKGELTNLSAISSTLKAFPTALTKLKIIFETLELETQPGIKSTLLLFALDTATAERDRLEEKIRHTKEMIRLAEQRNARLKTVIGDASAVINHIKNYNVPSPDNSNTYVYDQLAKDLGITKTEELVGSRSPLTAVDLIRAGPPAPDSKTLQTLYEYAQAVADQRKKKIDRPLSCESDPKILKQAAERLAKLKATKLSKQQEELLDKQEKELLAKQGENARPVSCEVALDNNVHALIRYVGLSGYHKYLARIDKHQKAIESHRTARREDIVDAREREQLITRSMQALAIFYQGGITAEDLARIIGLIEGLAIAIGVQ